jgi:4-oxalocrotonate tautomerase
MPIVTVDWVRGRSDAQKRAVAQAITRVLTEVAETDQDQVWVRIVDVDPTDWAVGGTMMG